MGNPLRDIFDRLAPRYELVNHWLTLGLDGVWRRAAARECLSAGTGQWLDVCSGTGELAQLLRQGAPANTLVVAADFSEPMLALARTKQSGPDEVVVAEASNLPFADGTFDLVTVSFATRNLHTSPAGLHSCFGQFARVLRPGGVFVNLETSQPPSALVRWLFHLYVGLAVESAGRLLSGPGPGYAYLAGTIPRFHDADALARVLLDSGFQAVGYKRLTFGAAAVHVARK